MALCKLEQSEKIASIAQCIATILALIIGGWWTYKLFIEQRQDRPRLKLEHKITHRHLPNNKVLLSVEELLSNAGSVGLAIEQGEIRVIQVLPLPPKASELINKREELPEIVRHPQTWPVLESRSVKWSPGQFFLEPGEGDQLHSVFSLDNSVKTISIVTRFENPTQKELGWQFVTLYDIATDPNEAVSGRQ